MLEQMGTQPERRHICGLYMADSPFRDVVSQLRYDRNRNKEKMVLSLTNESSQMNGNDKWEEQNGSNFVLSCFPVRALRETRGKENLKSRCENQRQRHLRPMPSVFYSRVILSSFIAIGFNASITVHTRSYGFS